MSRQKKRMISRTAEDAFYGGKRSDRFPFALNDGVVVIEGKKRGVGAAVISLEAEEPDVMYRVEYGDDGSMEILPASHLRLL
jgi:hypothetical protein